MCMSVLPPYICIYMNMYVSGARGGQKRGLEALELGFQ